MRITYIGKRLNGKKFVHAYLNEEKKELWFNKQLYPTVIGGIIECEATATGVKGPYKYVSYEDKKELTDKWWLAQAEAIGYKTMLNESTETKPGSLDALIERIKAEYRTPSQRRQVLVYLLSKL